jgi:FkbM family methyltransferase
MTMNIVHKLFRSLGRELTHPPKALAYNHLAQLRPSIGLLLTYLVSQRPNLFFIQVGANDGKRDDPIHEYVERFRLRGILIEPQPKTFESLKATYAHRPDLVLVNAAIAPVDGVANLYTVATGGENNGSADLLSSFDVGTIKKHVENWPGAVIQSVEVKTIAPSTLLANHSDGLVDMLVIDTEGYDYEALRIFDIPNLRPRIIQFEHRHLSRRDWESAVDLLVRCDYLVSYNWHNTIACNRNLLPPEYDERYG